MRIGLSLSSDMEVDHGALECLVSEEFLDMAYGDIGLDEMGGIGMPEHVWMDVLFQGESLHGALENGLDSTGAGVGGSGRCMLPVVVTEGREDPAWVAVGGVVSAEHCEGDGRQRHHAIHGTLAGVDMYEAAITEDVRDLEGEGLTQAQAEGVERGVEGAALEGGKGVDDLFDFVATEDRGKGLIALEADLVQNGPGTYQRAGEEVLDAAIADPQRGSAPPKVRGACEPVLTEVLLGDTVKRLLEEAL
jgi:hypothetical protein